MIFKKDNFWRNVISLIDKCGYDGVINFPSIINYLKESNIKQLEYIKELYALEKQIIVETKTKQDQEKTKQMEIQLKAQVGRSSG